MNRYNDEELMNFTKEQLVLHIKELYNDIPNKPKDRKNGLVFIGSPKWVTDYVDKVIKEERD